MYVGCKYQTWKEEKLESSLVAEREENRRRQRALRKKNCVDSKRVNVLKTKGEREKKGVRAEKRDRDAEREKETFRRQRYHQCDDGVDAETSLSLSLCISISLLRPYTFFLTLTFGL